MELARALVLDCQGRTTHTLVLEVDGTVTIRFHPGGAEARVDPRTRTVLTPSVTVPAGLLDEAAALRP
ncbi:hypothetical protein PO878_13440 [Iamia majanohamensis]|uniref:Uncharacterized protein n=1 Tax=Iamia majanohamensis TaxID=467976 RepID=A0AAE9YCY3_9ACTN|nr:hypothetical protein [Iamia majanohamensis]WCO65501.1 hypothetical protein PO878_13440 [Iamia majanohamensis]